RVKGSAVILQWDNDNVSKLHPLWLRDNCCCGLCLHHVSRENLSDLRDIPEDIQAASVAIDDEGALCIVWSHGEHRSRFNPAWLYAHSGHQPISRLTAELWDTAKLPEPPTFCADKGIVSDSLLYDVLVSVARHGIARLRDLPTDLELVEDFALRIGAIRETHFDRIFDVISKADGDSNAYTTGYLAAHTDIPTREAPPGIQVLHARIAEAQGGESLMTDGFKVAQDIEREFPQQYKTLTSTKWCYANRAGPKDYRWEAPTIGLDDEGKLLEIRMLPFSRAPLQGSFEAIDKAYAALRCYMTKANSPNYQMRFSFQAGDLIIFDNRRILHGRTEFFPTTGDRSLRGTYLDRDDVYSKIRQLQRQLF
ncbi:MAG: gamma-butyrobetaine dioxygenase, partial [Porticoccaceae bacterium]